MCNKNEVTSNYSSQKDKMPPLCSKAAENEIRELILQKLNSAELMYLSTISPEGWPIVDCVHFSTVKNVNNKPVFYIFTQENVRKIENIINNSRVAVSVCHAENYEKRHETWAFQFMGIAKIVNDETEKALATKSCREKEGYEFTQYLPLEAQPCIKIEPVFGSWMSGQGNPPACTIDYLSK